MNKIDRDGVDHINVYSKGKTPLGRFLSNFSYSELDTEDGKFLSVESYWYWLLTRREELREVYGYEAKRIGRTFPLNIQLTVEEFKTKIKKAIKYKIINSNMKETFIRSNLPFDHYYVYDNKIIDAGYKWIINYLTNLREELRDESEIIDGAKHYLQL